MNRTLVIRGLAVAALTGTAVLASWLIPRVTTPPDRFTVAMRLIDEGRADEAVYLLEDKSWVGVAQYRAGRYQRALYALIENETVDDLYNMGNAYARLHEWAGAKSAYRKALRLDPTHADAKFNLELVEQAEEAERRMVDDTRVTREMGRWKDGNREDPERGEKPGSNVERGGNDEGEQRPTDRGGTEAGTAEKGGQLGDKPQSELQMSGAAGGTADEVPPDGLKTGEGRALILRESAQATEVLLRQIRDDPERVLRARLRAAHRLRHGEDGG